MLDFVDRAMKVFKEAKRDNITGEAAKVAYYFFLSLFPLILSLFALTGLFGGDQAFEAIMREIRSAVPQDTATYLSKFVQQVTEEQRPGLLSVGVLLTLWSASNVFAALGDGLNTMYDAEETRSWWKKRLIAIGLLIVGSILLIVGAGAMVAGPEIVSSLGLGVIGNILRWPLAFAALVGLMWLIYYFLPNRDQSRSKKEVMVGAVVGTLVWILASVAFRFYVSNFGSYSETYGFVGAVIVLLLWLYITAIAILLGGEVAAELEGNRPRDEPEPQAQQQAQAA